MVAHRTFLLVFCATLVLQVLCQSEPRVSCPSGHSKAWSHFQTGGWGNLCPFFSTCAAGKRQSPIDVPSLPNQANLPASLQFNLDNTRVRFIRVGNYLTFPVNTNNTLLYNNKLYYLKRLEFHSPSEHTLQGRSANMEIQLYFEYPTSQGNLQAAVALLFNLGSCDDDFLSRVIPALPKRFRCECGNNRTEDWAPFTEQCDQGPDNAWLADRCRPGTCALPKCGDGVKDSAEECDEGLNKIVGSHCRPNCIAPKCGDGILDSAAPFFEECDDNNLNAGDGCAPNCTKECGDGCLQPVEVCDNGGLNSDAANASSTTCRSNCLRQRCGDGIIDFGEDCDIGNFSDANSAGGANTPNSCRPNCRLPKCLDGIVDDAYGEQCEPNPAKYTPDTDPCDQNCQFYCGDGRVEAKRGEQCDNGTLFNSNAVDSYCRPDCQLRRCGDGVVDSGEECDDKVDTPRCYGTTCLFRCGDGNLDAGEECDNGDPSKRPLDGNSDKRPNSCRTNCKLFSCGDGIVDPLAGEQCDDGPKNNDTLPNACRTNCKLPYCGDQVVDKGEQCDDGNQVDDDKCSCCRNDCGDGVRQNGEDCDDGAANSNTAQDRCRTNCKRHFCGDGVTDSDEECDPKSTNNPGCTTQCKLPFCGDGIVQSAVGEECDLGAANSFAELNGCSPICTLNRCGQSFTNTQVNLRHLIPTQAENAFTYQGSETHPPCSENVQWFVVPKFRSISPNQLAAFTNLISRNNRPVQSLNGRNPLSSAVPLFALDARAGSICGNNIVEPGELCDDGHRNSDIEKNACRTNCLPARCGDGVHDFGEECDGEAFCSPTCKRIRSQYRTVVPAGTCWSRPDQSFWPSCNNTCSGSLQSPIRLPSYCPLNRPFQLNHDANIQYNPTPLILFNTGDNIIFPVTAGGTFSWKGTTYVLTHVEFHQPSEHYIGTKQFAFEVQLFHVAQNSGTQKLAALSVLFDEGKEKNAFLQTVLDRLPPASNCHCGNGIKEDAQLLPDGRIAREQCDLGKDNSDSIPNRCRTNCRLPSCGDGVVDSNEICDQGPLNSLAPNHCRPNCALPSCGDGVVDDSLYEYCDDGNNRDGDGCSKTCQRECGNGKLDGNEQCDDGALNSDTRCDACRTSCRPAFCGDNVVDSNEQCDDGKANSDQVPNACRSSCKLPKCGDGIVDPAFGEECDGGSRCGPTCKLLCGNGRLDADEECDNGALNSDIIPNACRTNCRLPSCGDGTKDSGEQCDVGSLNTPQCTNCRIFCGNGILDGDEECDDGLSNSDAIPNACRTNCQAYYCGDGVIDNLEECDAGSRNANASDACRPWCKLPKCGDGIVDALMGEQCDGGVGCGSDCQFLCGNGRLDPLELCDDGVRNSDYFPSCCRQDCTFPRCGDGVTDPNEECDDGPLNSNGPNSCRADCTLPTCGDGIVDHFFGESCDQGARNSLTAVDGCSPRCTLNLCRQTISLDTRVDPRGVLPKTPGAYRYQGSRNAPPCTENVDWFIFSTPSSITPCQLGQFKKVLSGNTRCLQPRNGRPVEFLEENAKCGDGMVEGNEECDNGPQNSDFLPNACRRNCRKARCGDGIQDAGEQCDGTPNCTPTCSLDCSGASDARPSGNASVLTVSEDDTVINVNFANVLAQ